MPLVLDEDVAFLMGCYYSDGAFREYEDKSDYGIAFQEKTHIDRYNLIKEACASVFEETSFRCKPSSNSITIWGKYILEFFKNVGLKRYGRNKEVPEVILNSRLSVIIAFLRGVFFDTHGFDKDGFIFTNENEKSTLQIATILNYMGIFADVRQEVRYGDFYNRLYITGEDAVIFSKVIGFAEKTKQDKALLFNYEDTARGKYNVIPVELTKKLHSIIKKEKHPIGYSELFKGLKTSLYRKTNFGRSNILRLLDSLDLSKSKELRDWYTFIQSNKFYRIERVKNVKFEALDIEVAADNLFIANGILTHNSNIGGFTSLPDTYSGGNAIQHHISLALEVKREKFLKQDGTDAEFKDDFYGQRVRLRADKNKLSSPGDMYEYEYFFREGDTFPVGIDSVGEILNLGVKTGLIDRAGPYYKVGDQSFQGMKALKDAFRENSKFAQGIYIQLIQKL
jgi:hypothetical protein